MIKYILSSICILFGCAAMWAYTPITDEELNLLDKELKQKAYYDKCKQLRIDSLKISTESMARISRQRFDNIIKLAEEYETFISDSSLFYFNQSLEIANLLNDTTRIVTARLGRVKVLSILGYFKEGVNELDEIENKGIPKNLENEWLNSSRQFYAYLTTYVKDNKILYEKYSKLHNYYLNLQIQHSDINSIEYKLYLAEHYAATNDKNNAKLLFREVLETVADNNNLYARAAHNMAIIRKNEGLDDIAAHYLALAAISDIKCSVKETMALQELAMHLYNKGDIKRAYNYISSSLADAVFCNARLRTADVSKIIPLIDNAYKETLDSQRNTLIVTNWLIGVLSFGLLIIIIFMVRQIRKVKLARLELKKANSIKEEYIGHFLDICSIYMDRLNNFSKIVTRKITAGQAEELLKMAKANKFTEGQHKQFYDIFDATFLHIYPTFVEDFNALLNPDEQIIIKEPGHLTTELRIYAFLRMGVEDSNKIANFLNYSVNTIYAYRNKTKNKAKNREDFEENVMKIGGFA